MVKKELKEYIEQVIFPEYQKNDKAHNIEHIAYVLKRCQELSFDMSLDQNMLYTIAAYHDIGHHVDAKNHEKISAQIMREDQKLSEFFSQEELDIMKEAIEDHRASSKRKPRNIYGKVLSSADRSTSVEQIIARAYFVNQKYSFSETEEEQLEKIYEHINHKYGKNGYAKSYVKDRKYEDFLQEIRILLQNKEEFMAYSKKVICQEQKELAKEFAIMAHQGQVRKNEPEKPMVIHPISVARILEEYGYDDHVIAAGYLHDVVEDTNYTLEDIEKEFGLDIANLVKTASEPDKSLSWEERKKHTIEITRKLPLRNKVVICADKINNIEDLANTFERTGIRDFSRFKRGEEQQKWYYTQIYQSLIENQEETLPIFQRFKQSLEKTFYKENTSDFLKDVVFQKETKYYQKLRQLHAKKQELEHLKSLCKLEKPFVIEFCGTPRTGKTTTISNLYDFFKKGGFKTKFLEEYTTSEYYQKIEKPKLEGCSPYELQMHIMKSVAGQLQAAVSSGNEIILVDRSLNDRAIWNYRRYKKEDMTKEQYEKATKFFLQLSKEWIDMLVIGYTDPLTSLKRDYQNSLALEPRRFLNLENINEYNEALDASLPLFDQSVEKIVKIDTTDESPREVALEVAEQIIPEMRKKYVLSLNRTYNPPNR